MSFLQLTVVPHLPGRFHTSLLLSLLLIKNLCNMTIVLIMLTMNAIEAAEKWIILFTRGEFHFLLSSQQLYSTGIHFFVMGLFILSVRKTFEDVVK